MTLAFEADAMRPVDAWCTTDGVQVLLADGRCIVTPLWWYPHLSDATPAQRDNLRLMLDGVHWPVVDEDRSVDGMLRGRKARGAKPPPVAAGQRQ